MSDITYAKGLEGVIAAETGICLIDGAEGRLHYRGYAVEDLVAHADYEEVAFLLLNEKLPTAESLAAFRHAMRSGRKLAPAVVAMIDAFPPSAHPMELLQSVTSYLSSYVAHRIRHSAQCDCRRTLHQVAQVATVVAAWARKQAGKPYVEPRDHLSHGANLLYMLRGEEPDPREGEIMDRCLVLHAEHGFNVSTFTARVVASTLSTCYCSISAAMGALYGSLHGGANERVMEMVDAIGAPDKARDWVHQALDRKQKVMGMGHRVYKAMDPRARIIETYLQELSERSGDSRDYEILKAVEEAFGERMASAGKPLYPNVDFFSGAVYRKLGIAPVLFTPLFAVARVAGWLAHILEQRKDNRLYRPKGLYNGPEALAWQPVEDRA